MAGEDEIAKALQSLPEPVRAYIGSPKLDEDMIVLGKKYGLHIDVIGSIGSQINLVLAGLVPLNEFPENIGYAVNDQRKTSLILADIESLIFAPLKAKEKESTKPMQPAQQAKIGMSATGPTTQIAPAPKVSPPAPTVAPNFAEATSGKKAMEDKQVPIVETKMTTTIAPEPMHESVPMVVERMSPPPVAKALGDVQSTKEPLDTTGIPKKKYPGNVDPYREPAE